MKGNMAHQLEMSLTDKSNKTLKAVRNAFLQAALNMRDTARKQFVNNTPGYDMKDLKEFIIAGHLFETPTVYSIKLTSVPPGRGRGKANLTHLFLGGTADRRAHSLKEANRGYIKEIPAIRNAIDESLISQRVIEALNRKK